MKFWTPKLYVVEIWWETKTPEWLFHAAFVTKKEANAEKNRASKSGYKFRVVPYVRADKAGVSHD